jgi:hypothetical protein
MLQYDQNEHIISGSKIMYMSAECGTLIAKYLQLLKKLVQV